MAMAPDLYEADENDDLHRLLERHLDALKLVDNPLSDPRSSSVENNNNNNNYNYNPVPDGHVSSNMDAFGATATGHSIGETNGIGTGTNKTRTANTNNQNKSNENVNLNNNDDGHWLGSKIMSQVKNLLDTPSMDVSSLIINKEMLKYDINERNAIYEEVHGVGNICPDESVPGMVETALYNLMQEVKKLPAERQKVYQRSLKTPHSYVHTRAFKLRFLRAELFDPKGAANRLITFLEAAVELFGEYTLQRPIQLTDFSKKELKVMNTGRVQLLPYRDRGGRRIVVGTPSHQHRSHDPVTRVKIHIYLWWVASESVETQRKGMVLLIIHNPKIIDSSTPEKNDDHSIQDKQFYDEDAGTSKNDIGGLPSFQFAKIYLTRRKSLPLRIAAFHICTPDSPYYSIVRSFNTAMVKDERARVKMHIGEDIENRYKLSGYGIPMDQLPITESGKIKTTHFKKWLQLRRDIEDPNCQHKDELENIIECPGMNDVVFRPSQSTMCHPGNVMFRGLVESKHSEHSAAETRDEKIIITRSVIAAVKNRGGRFLVWNNNTWWTELTDEKLIYTKIAIFFRNSKVSAKAKTNRQSTKSSTYIFADQNMDDKRRKLDNDCFGNV